MAKHSAGNMKTSQLIADPALIHLYSVWDSTDSNGNPFGHVAYNGIGKHRHGNAAVFVSAMVARYGKHSTFNAPRERNSRGHFLPILTMQRFAKRLAMFTK